MKKSNVGGVAVDIPTTVSHEGKTWKVSDRRIKGKFLCEGKDESKNPKSRLIRTKWLTPKEFVEEQDRLNKEYDSVDLAWSWDVTSLFREVVNKDNKEKDIEETALQREFKDGKWNVINPIDVENELGETQESSNTAVGEVAKEVFNMTKLKLAGLWALIVALFIALGVLLTRWFK